MSNLLAFSVLLFVSMNHAWSCGIPQQTRGLIIGGSKIIRGNYPWMVALMYAPEDSAPTYFCGGALLSTKHILSAAHCVNPKTNEADFAKLLPRDVLALLGAFNLSNNFETGRTTASISKIVVHDDWNPRGIRYDADLAMLYLDEAAVLSRFVRLICLWDLPTQPTAQEGVAVGWGKSENVSTHETIPKHIKTPIHENEDCFLENPRLAEISSRRTFCGGSADGTGVCLGDSGNGLLIKHAGIFYLKGIVSSSLLKDYSCDVTAYAIYTDVLKYKDWISNKMLDKVKPLVTTPEVSENDYCKDPNNNVGNCVRIDKCPKLLQMLKTNPLTNETRQFLRSSNCGDEGDMPKVCCYNWVKALQSKLPKAPHCGSDSQDRIIGGVETRLGEFPWMVLLAYLDPNEASKSSFKCAGNLINNRYVLTVAHGAKELKPISVRIGEWNLETEIDCIPNDPSSCAPAAFDVDIDEILIHPGFNPQKRQADIALIRLSSGGS